MLLKCNIKINLFGMGFDSAKKSRIRKQSDIETPVRLVFKQVQLRTRRREHVAPINVLQ